MKAVGNKVVIKKIDLDEERTFGDIVIPRKLDANSKMTKGEILSVGRDAQIYNIKEGDIVLYDTMSVFDNSKDVVVTNVENVILKVKE
jgi:co-chaperonin GroES (HSP10)